MNEYKKFSDFYPFYLGEHSNQTCRRLHFIGSTIIIVLLVTFILTFDWMYIAFMPIAGYGFAWVGHFFFEKNRPATFTYPFFSFMGDWKMYWEILTGEIKF